jgi:cell division protease FtsH
MSDAMGPLTFGKKEEQIFLGREIAQHQDYSEETAIRIDQEIKRFVTDNYARARRLLEEHKPVLLKIADELLVREVLDGEQVTRLAQGLPLDDTPKAGEPTPPSAEEPSEGRRTPARPAIVPPLNKPLPQE